MHGSMHVSGTYSWKKPGGAGGGSWFFGGGSSLPLWGVGFALPPPASLPVAVRLNDLRIVPSGIDEAQFPVLFPRNVEPHCVGFEKSARSEALSDGGLVT